MIFTVPTPPNLYNKTLANAGKMRNQGIEIAVNAIPVGQRILNGKPQLPPLIMRTNY